MTDEKLAELESRIGEMAPNDYLMLTAGDVGELLAHIRIARSNCAEAANAASALRAAWKRRGALLARSRYLSMSAIEAEVHAPDPAIAVNVGGGGVVGVGEIQ